MNEEPGTEPHGSTPSASPSTPDGGEPPPPETFAEMGLHPDVMRSIEGMGFALPMEVQRTTYRTIMAGRDLLVQSRTGSGKTAAFGIPFAQGLLDAQGGYVQALA